MESKNTNPIQSKKIAIGIDIGGTSTSLGVIDREGHVLYEKKPAIQTPSKNENPDGSKLKSEEILNTFIQTIVTEIKNAIDTVKKTYSDIELEGIGIGAPNANYYQGTIEQAVNLPFIGIIHFTELLRIHFPECPIIKITNDANAAALGEMIYGGGKNMKNFVLMTLGTGVGSGVIVNGNLVYGHDGFAGEIGHITTVPGGRLCGCGGLGHLETYCSAPGMVRTAFELMVKYGTKSSSLINYSFKDLTSKIIFEEALKGDSLANETFEITGNYLGEGLADVVHHLSPEAIFLFGGPVAAGDLIIAPTKKSMEKHLLPVFKGKIKILQSQLPKDSAAIVGASALVWKACEK
jgi:glucokinase